MGEQALHCQCQVCRAEGRAHVALVCAGVALLVIVAVLLWVSR